MPAPTPAASNTGPALDIAAAVPAAITRWGAESLLTADAQRESTESDASLSCGVTELDAPPPPPPDPLAIAGEPDPTPDMEVRRECPEGCPGP